MHRHLSVLRKGWYLDLWFGGNNFWGFYNDHNNKRRIWNLYLGKLNFTFKLKRRKQNERNK